MSISPFLSVNCPCDEALRWTKKQLSRADLHAVQTFDLHTARAGLHHCPCPNHGMEDCDCQMVILLVYGDAESPATIFLHGNDGQTWFSIADEPRQRVDAKLLAGIKQALDAPISVPQSA
ncbi:MAG: hypothetical protein HY867_18910 [Chloroflexi bacterium]|nr:hypothetical protein [Chloroflexota bacterium]